MTGDRWSDRRGGCLCGAVRYRISGSPYFVVACHCTDCQVRSGGAFSMSMPVPETGFTLEQGTPVRMESHHEERVKHSSVCEACHTRLWLTNSAASGVVTIKAGTLDDRSDLAPVAHLWTRSRQAWVSIPDDVLQYETQPTDYSPLVQAWQKREQTSGSQSR